MITSANVHCGRTELEPDGRDELDRCFRKAEELDSQLKRIAADADALVDEMHFGLFYDAGRKALSVGYDVENNKLQGSFYDLLASEARSAVFVAIAKNDIPQEAWFHMGRDAHVIMQTAMC